MLFKKKTKPGEHEIITEGTDEVMHINYLNYPKIPSIEEDPICMAQVIERLAQAPSVNRIVFHQNKKYEYGYNQTLALVEVANIYNHFLKQKKILSLAAIGAYGDSTERLQNLQYLLLNLLRTDPIGAYVEAKRIIRDEKIFAEKTNIEFGSEPYHKVLEEFYDLMDKTKLIKFSEQFIEGYSVGARNSYMSIFKSVTSPDYMYTRLMATPPIDGEEIDAYSLDDLSKFGKNSDIQIFNVKETIKPLYHLTPPEFKISEDKQALLDLARKVLSEHKPKTEEYLDIERMRQTFFNISRDLITELADHKHMEMTYQEIEELAHILVRYTVGFGLIETLLQDPNVQDITINSPIGQTPMFVVHSKYDECVTNIVPSKEDVDSWASKFRLLSARPLDEANPVLDTELLIPGARARVAIITQPLNPYGTSYAIRRHRDKPWTLPLFIENNMISDLSAGVLSFLIDGSRTILVAGTRGSGKTSLLGALLVEIMRKSRVLTVEDTLELPTEALRQLGYNIQAMKVRSALTKGGTEIAADEGIRTSLRLGDSSLIVGEIRSLEAFALYEAMRVGALANVVAGTIHGDSPYGVYDRVVNDLKVPRTSFKATDIIIVANPIRSSDGLHKFRRMVQVTEVRKEWEDDPLREHAFVDLFKYNSKTDTVEPTDDLINGESEILKAIGGQVKDWSGNWDAIWDNILLRAKIKRTIVDYARSHGIRDLLEAKAVIQMNDAFHKISDQVKTEDGFLDSKKIFFRWEEELKDYIKKNY